MFSFLPLKAILCAAEWAQGFAYGMYTIYKVLSLIWNFQNIGITFFIATKFKTNWTNIYLPFSYLLIEMNSASVIKACD